MKDSRWMVIANPEAGSGKVAKDWTIIAELLKEKGISFDYLFTDHKYHSIELMNSSIKKGYKNFIAVGGDGATQFSFFRFYRNSIGCGCVTECFNVIVKIGTKNSFVKTFRPR